MVVKMIVCKLIGGLGNQLFQYAYAENLAKQLNEKICLDISFYDGKLPTIYKFNIKNRITTNDITLSSYNRALKREQEYHFLQYVIRKLNHERIGKTIFASCARRGYYFNFDPFYYPSPYCQKENKYVYGYFQGKQYFELVEEEIRKQISLTLPMGKRATYYEKQIKQSTAIAVHIRMGDYKLKKNKYLDVCTDEYYMEGINYIKENVKNPKFFIFTNDAEIIRKKEYLPEEAIVVTGTKDYEDLILMKACQHFVISGSTFSWWGSFLCENSRKITVSPEKWMITLKDEPAIYREDMVKVKN